MGTGSLQWQRCVIRSFKVVAALAVVTSRAGAVDVSFGGGCPNMCSGHGMCSDPQKQTCTCFAGFTSNDCSQRLCPAATAWADYATADDTAHAALIECAGMGRCDRRSGVCACRPGFTGESCQRLRCPGGGNCNGNGRCTNLREAAALVDFRNFFYVGDYDEWDADMIYGCACDEGWQGYDCSQRSCPYGPDPLELPAFEAYDVQVIDCTCKAFCSGYVLLTLMGQTTLQIPHDATEELVEYRLEHLSTAIDVAVNFSGNATKFCSPMGTATSVTVRRPSAPRPATTHWNISADATHLNSSTGTAPLVQVFRLGAASAVQPAAVSAWGTLTDYECNRRGRCDHTAGVCFCYSPFESSDGVGGPGTTGDCGYLEPGVSLVDNCSYVVPAWDTSADAAECSGVGQCNTTSLLCNCTTGYSGWACDVMECATGNAWFDEPVYGAAHSSNTSCSNGGICGAVDGNCTCDSMLTGDNCAVLDCVTACAALHGGCATMAELAGNATDAWRVPQSYSYTLWDAHMLTNCNCNRSRAVDDAYSDTSDTFRGPYAFADTDWWGYDCMSARCPRGDDPLTAGANEIQRVNCTGGFGTFTLSFRGDLSTDLDFDATASEVKAALEALGMIRTVTVTFENSATAACSDAGNTFLVEFITERGDLPLLVADDANIYYSGGSVSGSVGVNEQRRGSREDVECAAHGVCDESSGRCGCSTGYQSADDAGTAWGDRGDCGWRNEWQTAAFRSNGNAYDIN